MLIIDFLSSSSPQRYWNLWLRIISLVCWPESSSNKASSYSYRKPSIAIHSTKPFLTLSLVGNITLLKKIQVDIFIKLYSVKPFISIEHRRKELVAFPKWTSSISRPTIILKVIGRMELWMYHMHYHLKRMSSLSVTWNNFESLTDNRVSSGFHIHIHTVCPQIEVMGLETSVFLNLL